MNIVKFIDTAIKSSSTIALKDWYNENLRGKYAYWIHCKYIATFDDIDEELNYIDLEKMSDEDIVQELTDHEIIYLTPYDEWVDEYIDHTATASLNSVEYYKKANSFVPDDNITMDELKKFRTWVATSLLEIKTWSDDDAHVLEYYKNGMNDDTIKWLTHFNSSIIINNPSLTTCGCNGNGNLSSLYNDSYSLCDPVSIYRSNIKAAMIVLFSNIDTWQDLSTEFLDEMIIYLENIKKSNLPLVTSNDVIDVYSCKCLGDQNFAQNQALNVIENLIQSFEWIRRGQTSGHKNSIATTLTTWASTLYENMEWN